MRDKTLVATLLFFLSFICQPACTGSASGPNRAPVAMAGFDSEAAAGSTILLDGSASYDPDGDEIENYDWFLLAVPAGAQVTALSSGEAAGLEAWQARIEAEASGLWLAGLKVSDGRAESTVDVVRIRVTAACVDDEDCGDDGLYCNGTDRCVDGHCVFTPTDCDDDDPCTDDDCNEESDSCENTPVTEPPATEGPEGDQTCDDGIDNDCDGFIDGDDTDCMACTTDGQCDDGNDCTDDRCEAGSCVNETKANGASCDDDSECTEDDTCQNGVCTGRPVDCSHLNDLCLQGVCDPETGDCQAEPINEGDTCEDGLWCTTNDTCQGGACLGEEVDCSHLDEECLEGYCDEDNDQCNTQIINENGPCDDGLYCSVEAECRGGECVGTQDRECVSPQDECKVGICDEENDSCDIDNAEDGTPCTPVDDPCVSGASCLGGTCQGGTACLLGCNMDAEPPRCYEIDPSNVGHEYLCIENAPSFSPPDHAVVVINTTNGTVGGIAHPNFEIVDQGPDLPGIGVFSFSSMNIPADTEIWVEGDESLALIICEKVDLRGTIIAAAWKNQPGSGGFAGGIGNDDFYVAATPGQGYQGGGGGQGQVETDWPYCHTPGGGGGFGRHGGAGGNSDAPEYSPRPGGTAGAANANSELDPLLGGSGGGGGASRTTGAFGGGGGGAIQITAGGLISVYPNGGINVAGAGGGIGANEYYGGGGGGGAGGGILLEAPTISIEGKLAANGGGGGGGRTDYWGYDQWCPQGTPSLGEDGPFEDRRADGGDDCDASDGPNAGRGGYGGAGVDDDLLGERGEHGWIGGGGGGAAGRIRLNTFKNQIDLSNSEISPRCAGTLTRCTLGDISLY